MRLDAEYYISKTLIPPLERIFNLVGANVRSWYEDMPKVQRGDRKELLNIRDLNRRPNTTTLHSFMKSRLCAVCKNEQTDDGKPLSSYLTRGRALSSVQVPSFGIDVCTFRSISVIRGPSFTTTDCVCRLLWDPKWRGNLL